MSRVSFRTVRLVAAKELRESLRDRRTLFVALVLPVLLYPLMMLAVGPLVSAQKQKLKQDAQPVAVTGAGAGALRRLVLDPRVTDKGEIKSPGLVVVESDDPGRDLRAGKIALWLETAADFDAALTSERTAKVTVHRDGSDDRSIAAWHKFEDALWPAVDVEIKRRLAVRGLPLEFSEPIHGEPDDIAPAERRAAYNFGKLLAFVLVVLTLSSSFYPAVDCVAGEKERGTMETLLVAPCGRVELVLGKFLAVGTVTLAAATLNLASMGLTLGPLMGVIAPEAGVGLQVTPPVLAGILALLVPLAALFSAVSLALSTLARSLKEGQHYLTPLFLVVMPLAMVVVLPDVPLTPALAPVPVTNAVLFFRDLLLGKTEPLTTAIVMLTTFGYAALALWGAVSLFLREETLFRGPEGSTRLIVRPAPSDAPSGGAALFLFAASLALAWYGQRMLPQDVVRNLLATQFFLVLAPCALLVHWSRVRLRTTFRLTAPPWKGMLLAVPIGLAAPIVNGALQKWIGFDLPPELHRIEEEIVALAHANPIAAVLLIGVLPAVCEELVFRGFVLSGFRRSFTGGGATARAVSLSAVLFALFHLFPQKWLPTFLMGLLLAFLCVRTGSIWPGMVAHALNNASAVLWDTAAPKQIAERLSEPAAITVASVVVAACVAVLAWKRPATES